MLKIKRRYVPVYMGWFVVAAMLPQIIGFNGTILDTVYKFMLIASLGLLVMGAKSWSKVSKFFAIYVSIYIFGTIGTMLLNRTGLSTEILALGISIALMYILYDGSRKYIYYSIDDVYVFYKIITYFIFVAAIYNMIINRDSLLNITSLVVYETEDIASFFDNKNTYGVFLLFGFLSTTILKIQLKQFRWTLCMIVFFVNEVMAMCRTAIIISFFLFLISFLIEERGRMRKIFFLILFFAVFSVLVSRVQALNHFVVYNLFGDTGSLDTRNIYVDQMLPLARGKHLLLGYGNENAMNMVGKYTGNSYYHNTYLKNLISGGIIKLILQIVLVISSFSYALRCRKYDVRVCSFCVISTITYLIYAYVESVVLLDTPVVSIMATMFVVSLPVLFYEGLKNEREIKNGTL